MTDKYNDGINNKKNKYIKFKFTNNFNRNKEKICFLKTLYMILIMFI